MESYLDMASLYIYQVQSQKNLLGSMFELFFNFWTLKIGIFCRAIKIFKNLGLVKYCEK